MNLSEIVSRSQTPLHISALHSLEAAKMLVKTGQINVDAKNEFGENALMRAVGRNSSPDMAKVLIEAGSDLELKNLYGNTALHQAAFMGNVPPLQALLDAGALLETVNDEAQTALHRGCVSGKMPVVKALLVAGVSLKLMGIVTVV